LERAVARRASGRSLIDRFTTKVDLAYRIERGVVTAS